MSWPIYIKEQVDIDRPPGTVWQYVIVPENFMRWNPKIASMEAAGYFSLNQRFASHYRMKNKPLQCMSEVRVLEAERVLELRHFNPLGEKARPEMEAVERITLAPKGEGTRLIKEVTITNHGTPWWLMPLVWFVTRLGKPTQENPLKRLLEESV